MYWVDIQNVAFAQRKGLKFYQTKSNAIILYDTLPAYCIPKAVMMESGEVIYEKVFLSPRLPPRISFKDDWMKELDSEVAGGSEDSQRIQPKNWLKKPIIKNKSGDPFTQEIGKDALFLSNKIGREGCDGFTKSLRLPPLKER